WRQADYKPNSVRSRERGDHSSRLPVSRKLVQPTRKLRRAAADARKRHGSLFGLAPCGGYQADPLPNRWCALTAPFHPYWGVPSGIFSVALSVSYEPPSYEAHCPAEFGLSSRFPPRSPVCLPTL